MTDIISFKGEYAWLSNFYLVDIEYNGLIYPSVEHAYVASKTNDMSSKLYCTNKNISSGSIKKFGRSVNLIDNFDQLKYGIMYELVSIKFNDTDLKNKLIETHGKELIEGNYWNDKYWGVCMKTNKGQNNLGKILMNIRDTIIHNEFPHLIDSNNDMF